MHKNELRNAVGSLVGLLQKTKLQEAISEFRTALLKNQHVAAGKALQAAGHRYAEHSQAFSPLEKKVCHLMHLDSLASVQYWNKFVSEQSSSANIRAEILHLYSRVMFVSDHLPNLLKLTEEITTQSNGVEKVTPGCEHLTVKLCDAGESASNPDRISRTIDAIDMLYSACMGLAKNTNTSLSLVGVKGQAERYVTVEGDAGTIKVVKAIIGTISDAIARIDDVSTFDPGNLIASLPVFNDLRALQQVGALDEGSVIEISEFIHEGSVLILESGVMLETPAEVYKAPTPMPTQVVVKSIAAPVVRAVPKASAKTSSSANEYYQEYLRKKNDKLSPQEIGHNVVEGTIPTLKAGQGSSANALDSLISDLDDITDH